MPPAAVRSAGNRPAASPAEGGGAGKTLTPRLAVPARGISTRRIIKVGVKNHRLNVGESVTAVYTWKYGVTPGHHGSAVIAGHTCHFKCTHGVFDHLGKIHVGDRAVTRTPKTSRWRATKVLRHVRNRGPKFWSSLYKTTGPPRLVLITCGDPVDGSNGVYKSRIVVFFEKVTK